MGSFITKKYKFLLQNEALKNDCKQHFHDIYIININVQNFDFRQNIEVRMDYKQMYNQKCNEFEQLNLQFAEYQQQSNFIINDLEQENKQMKKKYQILSKQLNELKEKKKNFSNSYEKQIEQTKKEKEQFKNKFIEFEKKVIELQNINQSLQSDLRATKATLNQYEQRIQKTMEQLAFLQSQMQESTESNQEQIARLRSQLKQTEDELYALHHAKNNRREETMMMQKENGQKQNESFHSKHSAQVKRSEITDSKVKKKNPKFGQTLAQIRAYINQISKKREQMYKRFQQAA